MRRYQPAMAKYDPLRDNLKSDGGPLITLSFTTISRLVGGLPDRAHRRRARLSCRDRGRDRAAGGL